MFLDGLRRRNPRFLSVAAELHQSGALPANSVALDIDAIEANAAGIAAEARRLGLEVFAMTKQIGRHPAALRAIRAGGIGDAVAVDMPCARAAHAGGLGIGHIGHLVQVPRHEAAAAARLRPRNWTVFDRTKAAEASAAAQAEGTHLSLLARVWADADRFYPGHEGGVELPDLERFADDVEALDAVTLAGVTTFPALAYDPATRTVRATPNLTTLTAAAALLAGRLDEPMRVNAPGTTSAVMLAALADVGATQVEPGHGLTGTTPLHAVEDLPELPAAAYVTEVSHSYGGRAYCFGGGFYIDPVFAPYQVRALVVPPDAPGDAFLADVAVPAPEVIDYYAQLTAPDGRPIPPGSTVICGFRIQAFVTRSYVAGISRIATGPPIVELADSQGRAVTWP